MRIKINGEPRDFEAYSLSYGNDMLDGVILDLDEDYIWLSDHVEEAREMQAQLPDDIEHFDMSGCDIDFSVEPHCYVLQAVARLVVRSAEKECEGA